jgi:hypothetical protein
MHALTGPAIEDASCRLLPFKVAHSTDALLKRGDEIAEVAVAKTVTTNTEGTDVSTKSWTLTIIARLARESTVAEREKGFTRTDIKRRCLAAIAPKSARRNVGPLIDKALEALVGDPASGLALEVRGKSAVGTPVERFMVAAQVLSQAR